jgi:iron complex outermembrane receptor protein
MARTVLVGALVCLALILAEAAAAQEVNRKYPIDIRAQGLTTALEQLSNQTQIYYGFSPESDEQEKLRVGPVRGEYTIEEALNLLLQSTGFTFTHVDSKNIAIVKAPPAPPKVVPRPQVKAPPPLRTDRRSEPPPGLKTLEEVVTTWRHNSIARFSLPAPVSALDLKFIARTGARTVGDLMRYLSQQPYLRPDASQSNGAQYIELRGLGFNTTKVLINGHHVLASAASFPVDAFDTNQIPLSAVQRVEIRFDSISVLHGADAIGGIVNIVLRDDITEPTVQVGYGSAQGGGEERQASLSAGRKGAEASVAVILDYRDVTPLLGVKRELWSNQDYERFGSIDRRTPLSSPGNVRAVLPGNLPGLSSPIAGIPGHTAGPVTAISEFHAGETNLESLLRYSPIVAEDRRASAVATAHARINSNLLAAADLLVVDRSVRFPTAPPLVAGKIVPATNPYNSFHQPVFVTSLLAGASPAEAAVDSLLIRAAASLAGKANTWDWELAIVRSEEDADFALYNLLDDERLDQVLADPDPARTVNLLGPGPAATPDVLASLLTANLNRYATDGTQLSGFVSGELFAVPAGKVTALVGGDWRKESVQFDSLLGAIEREVASGFAELRIPVLSEAMSLPAMQELSVTLAGRFDRYTDFGEVFNPQYGLLWKPHDRVAVRAIYGRSFRPPSIFELDQPAVGVDTLLLDPRRNLAPARVTVISGGNPELAATHGESFTASLEFSPVTIDGLKFSTAYWRVEMDNRVTALPLEFALTHEAQIPGRVLRAAPTAADLAAGLPGQLLQLDLSRLNFGHLMTSGIDVGASYRFENGARAFGIDARATWIDDYRTLDLPGTATTDRVSVANSLGTIAKWRAILGLDWERGVLGASAHARYVPAYADTLNGIRTGRTLPAQTFVDLQLSLTLKHGFALAAGAYNVFDEQPDFAEVNGPQGYDASQGDLKGRFWYLRLGKTF